MIRHGIQTPAARLSGFLADVHQLATGRELQLNDALEYFSDPRRLASIVERERCPDGFLETAEARIPDFGSTQWGLN